MTDTCVNFYGSALDLNKDDGEEDLDIIIVEVIFQIAIALSTKFIFY